MNVRPLSQWRGCLPAQSRTARKVGSGAGRLMVQGGAEGSADWVQTAVPCEQQNGGSCVAHGWANWLEHMLRRTIGRDAIPPGMQLDGDALYLEARRWFYRDEDLNGGLAIPQGFEAMKLMAWIDDDSELVEVDASFDARNEALRGSPLVVGHHVHHGWENPSPVNGCLNHYYAPTVEDGYHCTLEIGQRVQAGNRFAVRQNSWGKLWGWHGLYLQSEDEDQRDIMADGPYTAILPATWLQQGGWKQGLVRDANW